MINGDVSAMNASLAGDRAGRSDACCGRGRSRSSLNARPERRQTSLTVVSVLLIFKALAICHKSVVLKVIQA